MDKSEWMTSTRMSEVLRDRRDNDVKVELNGILVPIARLSYLRVADCFVIELDEECEDYRVATSPPLPAEES